jgi:hypothetical protein
MKDSTTAAPFSHVWGFITNIRLCPSNKIFILVRIAGKEYRFVRFAAGLEEMNLFQFSKKRRKVLLVFYEGVGGDTSILAGWNNPSDGVARYIIQCTSVACAKSLPPHRLELLQLWRECITNHPHWNAPKPR